MAQLLQKEERIRQLEAELSPAMELIEEAEAKIRGLEAQNKELKDFKDNLEKSIHTLMDEAHKKMVKKHLKVI